MKEYFCFSLLPDQNVVFARNGCDFSKKGIPPCQDAGAVTLLRWLMCEKYVYKNISDRLLPPFILLRLYKEKTSFQTILPCCHYKRIFCFLQRCSLLFFGGRLFTLPAHIDPAAASSVPLQFIDPEFYHAVSASRRRKHCFKSLQ